jgi:sortase A
LYSPAISPPSPKSPWNEPVQQHAAELAEQRLYIPRLSLNLQYESDQRVLNNGLWHRYPERGEPEKGGNFILAGHRFELGLTPGETRRKSPLYHIDKIQVGDYIYADFNGKRYQYEITRRYTVKPNQTEIEAPSDTPKMTMYTCTFKGTSDGREVLEAKLIESDVDPAAKLLLDNTHELSH